MFFRQCLLSLFWILVAGIPAFAATPARSDTSLFDVPAQSMAQTLIEFSKQFGVSVATSSTNLDGLKIPALSIEAPAADVLENILIGTGLEAKFLDEHSVVIVKSDVSRLSGIDESRAIDNKFSEGALDNIVVTAKGRQSLLSETSLAISALVREDLRFESLGLSSVDQLDLFAPSLNLRTPSGRGSTTIAMRGLSPNTTNSRLQGVSVFVDGIAVSGPISSLAFLDVERVEVVRGPQSTLFGRSTYSGAIDIVTSSPMPDRPKGEITVGASQFEVGDTPRYVGGLRLEIPLVQDRLAASLTGKFDRLDSFARTPSDSTDIGGEESKVFGVTLYGEPNDRLSFKFRHAQDKSNDEDPFVHIVHPDEWLAAGVDTVEVGDGTIWPVGEVLDPEPGTTECQPSLGAAGAVGRGRPPGCGSEQKRDFTSWIFNYDFSNYRLSYRGGYMKSQEYINSDFGPRGNTDGLGADPFFGPGMGLEPGNKSSGSFIAVEETNQNISHQIRLVSDDSSNWRWLLGAYAFSERNQFFRINNYAGFTSSKDIPRIQSRATQRTQNTAVFGQLEWDATDQLTTSFEGRYQRETIKADSCRQCLSSNLVDLKETEFEFLPRFTLTWRPNDQHTVYALYAKGTKSARFNLAKPSGFFGDFSNFVYVDPETLDSVEIGMKSCLFKDRLHINTAFYYQDIKDQQRTFQLEGSTGAFTDNVAKSKVVGFEVETTAVFSDSLKADIAIGYSDHEFLADFAPGSIRDSRILNGRATKGLTSVGVPKTTINLGLEYVTAIANTDYKFRVRTDAVYRSKQYVDIANQAYIPGSVKLNLLADIGNEKWGVSTFARNIFDDRVANDTFSGASSCTYTDPAFTRFNDPQQLCLGLGVSRGREIGIGLRFNF